MDASADTDSGPPIPECGNGYCRATESCEACSADCCCVADVACGFAGCKKAGACCVQPQPFPGKQYGGLTYTNWDFGVPTLDSQTTRFCLDHDPGDTAGFYFQTYDGNIGPHGTYHGLQIAPGVGRQIIFSRFDGTDGADIRVGPGAVAEVRADEGHYIRVRMPYLFTASCYDVRLRRADEERGGDWFELHVRQVEEDTWTYVGALRFPRENAAVPVRINNGGGTWMEEYIPIGSAFDIPYTHVSLWAWGNEVLPPVTAWSNYNANDGNPIVNTDVWYDPGTKLVHHEFGGMTPRCHAPGTLF